MATPAPKKSMKFPLAIRDDGLLYLGTPKILRQGNYRPYHGDPYASLEERLRWLRGGDQVATAAQVAADQGVFDIGGADKGELLEFVFNETGKKLDSRKSLATLRLEAAEVLADTNTAG